MIKVTTESGSVYLIDEEKKLLKREGKPGMTKRATEEWRPFDDIVCGIGRSMAIFWTNETPLFEGTKEECEKRDLVPIPATTTSLVVSIEDLD